MTSNNNLMIVLIVLLCLLAVIGAITTLVLRKRRKSKASRKNTTPYYTSTTWQPRKVHTDKTSSLGWGMITVAWLLVLGFLYVLFEQWMERLNNPNRDLNLNSIAGGYELILKRNRSGHYVVPGTINNQPVTFMVDTGATLVSVPAHQGPALGLKPGAHGKAQTANGIVNIRFTKIESLVLGPFHLREVQAALNPGQNDHQVLLGMNVLKDLELTQSGRNLIIRPRTP